MENIILLSRYPQSNRSLNKKHEIEYSVHKKKIEDIMTRQRLKHSESNPYLEMIRRSKLANQRIKTLFDTKKHENQMLLIRLTSISRRKFQSECCQAKDFHAYNQEDEKKRIKMQNYLLGKRLEEYKKNTVSRRSIKRQMKVYFDVRKKLRRVKNNDSKKKLR